jgi:hypothetical protein
MNASGGGPEASRVGAGVGAIAAVGFTRRSSNTFSRSGVEHAGEGDRRRFPFYNPDKIQRQQPGRGPVELGGIFSLQFFQRRRFISSARLA